MLMAAGQDQTAIDGAPGVLYSTGMMFDPQHIEHNDVQSHRHSSKPCFAGVLAFHCQKGFRTRSALEKFALHFRCDAEECHINTTVRLNYVTDRGLGHAFLVTLVVMLDIGC